MLDLLPVAEQLFDLVPALLAAFDDTRSILVITVIGVVVNALVAYTLMFGNFGFPRLELVGAATELLTTDAEETVRELLAADRGLTGLEVTGASLEEAFLAITGGRHEAAAAYTEGVPA